MPNLVGIGLSQVPTNSMLGGLAYQSPDHASIENLDLKYISQINAETADTAVDVFVYDTSKDSDGGAWRKRTQNTTWYNETLNTATRGSRKEFPAVAVIVLTGDTSTSQATIYDGDDPDLPMWMVIPDQSIDWANNNGAPTSTAGLNGKICFTCSGSGITILDFVSDTRFIHYVGQYTFTSRNILSRSSSAYYAGGNENNIVNQLTNDVAMTVLPSAPIDETTGLLVPTIAVATDSGVSVIKDDGTVVDAVGTGFDEVNSISFDKNNRIICSSGTAGTDQAMFSTFAIPSSDLSNDFPGGDNAYYRHTYVNTDLSTFPSNGSASNQSINEVSIYGDDICFGTEDDGSTLNPGLKIISENVTFPANGMLCGVSTSYNTGWMHGDIKGAFLSDTDTTDVTGTELVTNGGFELNSDWDDYASPTTSQQSTEQSHSGTFSWKIVADGSLDGISQTLSSFTTETNKAYILSGWFYSSTGEARIRWRNGADSDWLYDANLGNGTSNVWQPFAIYARESAGGTNMGVRLTADGSGTFYFDDISIKKAEEDRSVNDKGLQVFGTITKSAVATGVELVGYSGFSASNYLEQPTNSDIYGFGAGDFSIIFWVNYSGTGSYDAIITVSDGTAGGWGIRLGPNTPRWQFWDTNSVRLNTVDGQDGWHQIAFIRSGTTLSGYFNGELANSSNYTTDLSRLSAISSSSTLRIGNGGNSGSSLTLGSYADDIALLRLSNSAPSAEQIKKIYEDEKYLFQENAKATLYGSSDAVTALAYDEKTELLHVGTSSGRSDFNGLRRINNTTTAVTTAISAYDGSIAQQ